KPDAAAMHAKDRHPLSDKTVQRFEHEPVAAERHDDAGLFRGDHAVALPQFLERLLRRLRLGGHECDPRRPPAFGRGDHPPVTLIWRAIAGRLWRRSIMKSWPLGLRGIASRLAVSAAASPSGWRRGVGR